MPVLLHAPGIGRGSEIEVPISELEAWGTNGWSVAAWIWRSGEYNNGGNITPIVHFTDGAGSSTGADFGLGANSGTGGGAYAAMNVNRNTDGASSLSFIGTANGVNGNQGYIGFNRWAGVCVAVASDSTAMPVGLYYNNQMGRYDWTLGYRGAVPAGKWTATAPSMWLGRSTYWGFPGALAFVQLWNRQLTQAEMLLALTTPGSVRNGLTLYLPLERDLRDEGPLRRHGRFIGAGDLNAQMKGVERFPTIGDGSGFGYIPKIPVRGVRMQGMRLDLSALEAPAPGLAAASASGAVTLPALTASGTGVAPAQASGVATLPRLTASGTAKAITRAQGVVTLPHLTAGGAATAPVRASGTAQLPRLQASGTAVRGVTATAQGRATLPALVASGSARVFVSSTGVAILPHLMGSGQAGVLAQSLGLARFPMFVASGRGYTLPVGAQIGELAGSTTVHPRLIGIVAIRPILTGTVRI